MSNVVGINVLTHLHYLRYLLRHKWFVLLASARLGIIRQGLLHDLSKFRPSEWVPYVEGFYGPKYPSILDYHGDSRNRVFDSGAYKERVRDAFDVAWLAHIHRNPHHPQHWVLREDSGGTKILPMPTRYVLEMIADWVGAGLAQGKPDIQAWYRKNRDKILLHPSTREHVDALLKVQDAEVGK